MQYLQTDKNIQLQHKMEFESSSTQGQGHLKCKWLLHDILQDTFYTGNKRSVISVAVDNYCILRKHRKPCVLEMLALFMYYEFRAKEYCPSLPQGFHLNPSYLAICPILNLILSHSKSSKAYFGCFKSILHTLDDWSYIEMSTVLL